MHDFIILHANGDTRIYINAKVTKPLPVTISGIGISPIISKVFEHLRNFSRC